MVRSILNGRYANTAFCIFDPQGRQRLSRSGRSPSQLIKQRSGDDNEAVIKEMNRIASRYAPKRTDQGAVLQDFLSFKQALLVAAADQRLLVFVNAEQKAIEEVSPTLRELFSEEEMVGRFHVDFSGDEDRQWTGVIKGAKSEPGIYVVRAGKYGLDGVVVTELPLTASKDELKKSLLADNEMYALIETRKVYADHVFEGKRKGIKFESEIPYGEDRDGDGKIDKPEKRGGGKGRDGANGRGFRSRMRLDRKQ